MFFCVFNTCSNWVNSSNFIIYYFYFLSSLIWSWFNYFNIYSKTIKSIIFECILFASNCYGFKKYMSKIYWCFSTWSFYSYEFVTLTSVRNSYMSPYKFRLYFHLIFLLPKYESSFFRKAPILCTRTSGLLYSLLHYKISLITMLSIVVERSY